MFGRFLPLALDFVNLHLPYVKGPGKSNHTSPDMPNKKRRSVFTLHAGLVLTPQHRMSSRSEMPATAAPKDEDESGIPGLLSLSSAPVPQSLEDRQLAPPPTERIVKTPQLPLHDTPALATAAVAVQ